MKKRKVCIYDACPYDRPSFANDDRTSVFAHLGARAGFTTLAWIALMKGVVPGQSFFTGLSMLAMSLLFDYLKFSPQTAFRRNIVWMGYVFTLFWLMVGITGLFQVITIVKGPDGLFITGTEDFWGWRDFYIPARNLWAGVGFTLIGMTIVDWVTNISAGEAKTIQIQGKTKGP